VSDLAVEVSGLRKSSGPHEAVKGIDLSVARSEVFGFLGTNAKVHELRRLDAPRYYIARRRGPRLRHEPVDRVAAAAGVGRRGRHADRGYGREKNRPVCDANRVHHGRYAAFCSRARCQDTPR
jgi:hypothetical protein